MKYIYAVLDLITKDIGGLMLFPNDGSAIRRFQDLLANTNEETSVFRDHAEDFALIRLGTLTPNGHDGLGLRITADTGTSPDGEYDTIFTGQQWKDMHTNNTKMEIAR